MTPETAAKSGLSRRGRKRPQHVRDAVSKAQLGNTNKLGKVVSAETRAKIGHAHKDMKHTHEAIEKIKMARAKQAPIKWSAESRANFSALVKSLGRVPPSRLGCRKAQGEISSKTAC